jgi:flagellar protein FliJ
MKKFNFRLENILMLKEFYEMEAKLKYAETLQQKIELENKNIEMEKTIFSSMNDFYSEKKNGDVIRGSDFSFQDEYISNLLCAIKINDEKKEEIKIELNTLKEKLVKATKEKKTFEELKKRDKNKYKEKVRKEETKRLDDVANQFYLRGHKNIYQ